MRSKAHIKGHPIHPMLVAFPIAFLYGAFVADVAGRAGGWPSVWTTGAYLIAAAVASGLLAAVPGLIDYFYAVPPNSTGKRRATPPLGVNASALVAFSV